ncbi:MAG: hypothetical protein AMXMBFR59_09470 [Rhodanobacteraceae bacterium]
MIGYLSREITVDRAFQPGRFAVANEIARGRCCRRARWLVASNRTIMRGRAAAANHDPRRAAMQAPRRSTRAAHVPAMQPPAGPPCAKGAWRARCPGDSLPREILPALPPGHR